MQTLNTKLRLLCTASVTSLALTACQAPVKPVVVVPVPVPAPVPIALIPPLPQPVIVEDPLVVEIKKIDRADIEARINLIGKYARHYPVRFDNVRARRGAEAEIKDLLKTVNPIASNPKATHNELVQGFKVNGMARNLDVGSNTTTNADNFIRRALKLEPKNPATNYWFGVLLSEGGGMKEGIPYLSKAAKSKYYDAHLSLANAYLGLGNKAQAMAALRTYQDLVPNDPRIPAMLDAVKENKASIW